MKSTINLNFCEAQPYIRYVQRLCVTNKDYPDFANYFTAYDCRLFLVSNGSGYFYTQDARFRLSRGDLVLWHAGNKYRMISDKDNLLIMYGCNFDFTQSNKSLVTPIPPEPSSIFDENKIWENVHFTDMPAMNQFIYLKNMQSLEATLQEMLTEYQSQKIFCDQRLSGMFLSILSQCYRTISLGQDSRSLSSQKIEEILNFIQEHYSEDISNDSIGYRFNYHPNYLNKQVMKYTGKSIHQYLLTYRVSRAYDMIISTDLSISEIAARTGFHDIHHFSRTFHKKMGMSPSELRSNK